MSYRITKENLENVVGHINTLLKRKKSPYRILIQYHYGKVYACKAKESFYTLAGKKCIEYVPAESSFTGGTKSEVYEALHALLLGMRMIDEAPEDRKRFKSWEAAEKERNAYILEESKKRHEANKESAE